MGERIIVSSEEFEDEKDEKEEQPVVRGLYKYDPKVGGLVPTTAPEPPEPIDWQAVKQEAWQIGGGVMGGAVGIPAGFPGVVGGVALGATAGEAYYQYLQALRKDPKAPKTSAEAARRMGWAGIEETAYEIGGQVIGRGIGRIIKPIRKLKPEAKEVIKAFEKEMDPILTVGEAAESRVVGWAQDLFESSFADSLWGISKFKGNRIKKLDEIMNGVIDKIGKRASPEEAAEAFAHLITDRRSLADDMVSTRYNQLADDLFEKEIDIKVNIEVIKLRAKKRLLLTEKAGKLEAKHSGRSILEYMQKLDDVLSFDAAKELRSLLLTRKRQLSRKAGKVPASEKITEIIEELHENIVKSINDTPRLRKRLITQTWEEGGKTIEAKPQTYSEFWKRTGELYKDINDTIQGKTIKKLMNLIEGGEQTGKFVARKIFTTKGRIEEIKDLIHFTYRGLKKGELVEEVYPKRLTKEMFDEVAGILKKKGLTKQIIEEKRSITRFGKGFTITEPAEVLFEGRKLISKRGAEVWEKLQSFHIQDLFDKSIVDGMASGSKLKKELKKLREAGILQAIYNDPQIKSLNQYADALELTKPKVVGMEASILRHFQFGAVITTATGYFRGPSIAIMLAPSAISMMLARPKFAKYLIEGLKTPVGSSKSLRIIKQIIDAGGKIVPLEQMGPAAGLAAREIGAGFRIGPKLEREPEQEIPPRPGTEVTKKQMAPMNMTIPENNYWKLREKISDPKELSELDRQFKEKYNYLPGV
jgi:hypothetical protein